jgi:hypothetical protein
MATIFQSLAEARLQEAKCLYDAELYSGAYYLAGYAVELAIKALIVKGFFAENIPDLEHVKKIYDHDLERLILLVRLEGFQRQFQELKRASADFETHWSAVKDWKSSSRYVIWDQKSAGTLLSAVHDPEHGVFQWIRRFW